jgi:hypothetical protein
MKRTKHQPLIKYFATSVIFGSWLLYAEFLKMAKVIIMGGVMQQGHKPRTSKATMVNSQPLSPLQVFDVIKLQQ